MQRGSLPAVFLYMRHADESPLVNPADAGSAGATQGLSLGDMFSLGPAGELQPVLRELAVPVRAIVMPLLDRQASRSAGGVWTWVGWG